MCSLAAPAGRRLVPGQPEQVVALVEREVQALGDGGHHLLGRLRARAPARAGRSSRSTCGTARRPPRGAARCVLRRCPRGRPTSSGCSASRRRRRKPARPARSITVPSSRRPLFVHGRPALSHGLPVPLCGDAPASQPRSTAGSERPVDVLGPAGAATSDDGRPPHEPRRRPTVPRRPSTSTSPTSPADAPSSPAPATASGLELAARLAAAGAEVVLPVRNRRKGEAAARRDPPPHPRGGRVAAAARPLLASTRSPRWARPCWRRAGRCTSSSTTPGS